MPETKIKITPAKGRPMLYWIGKKPLDFVKGFPAQLVELFDPEKNNATIPDIQSYENLKNNWNNLLFHGDNKEVLATLLENGFRGKIDLIYIDPPFKSGADYVRKVELRGLKNLGRIEEDEASVLQQTMYFDIWNNDAYLQFMYERLMLLKELLSDTGSIYVHLDWHVGHYIKLLMDEVFGQGNFRNEIVWHYRRWTAITNRFQAMHDTILFYGKSSNSKFNVIHLKPSKTVQKRMERGWDQNVVLIDGEKQPQLLVYNKEKVEKAVKEGKLKMYKFARIVDRSLKTMAASDVFSDITYINSQARERTPFATQKPEALLERIIKASSNQEDLVLDCFPGSGTTLAVAQKLGRRWIGCDINKGAIQITSKRLQKIIKSQIPNSKLQTNNKLQITNSKIYSPFAIYKVNDYDLKLLKTEAIELAVQHIGIQRSKTDSFFNGYLGKNLVKIIDFNHPLTLLDLQLVKDELKKRPEEDRDITIVCLGKELAVDPEIEKWNKTHPINKIKVIELKTDKKYGNFLIHKPAEAKIKIDKTDTNKVIIEILNFISPTIIKRLNIDTTLFKVKIPDFRCMIDTILIDTNYDSKVFHVAYSDIPERKNDLIKGKYEIEIPKSNCTIAVKIIDMLGEEVINVFEV